MEKYNKVEKVLNDVMKRSFPWWKKIEISQMYFREGSYFSKIHRNLVVKGLLYVDENWVEEQFEKINDHKRFYKDNYDEENELDLGDVITVEEAKKIYDIAQYVITGVLNIENINEISLTYVHLRFV